jgi:hypothetical protein
MEFPELPYQFRVMRGLDPRIHPRIKSENAGGTMDGRVKPGHDADGEWSRTRQLTC